MINRHLKVDSANILKLGYDPFSAHMEVIFTEDPTKAYVYTGVTAMDYAQLLNATSIGSHFAKTIRKDSKKYPFTVKAHVVKS